MEHKIHEVIIIGSGPAGLTAGIYTSRAALQPILFAGEQWGGQLMWTTEVENFPGFPDGILGADLMINMVKQAEKFGTTVKYKNVTSVDLGGDIKKVFVGEEEFLAKSVILSSGSTPRRLNIPGEDKFYGKGVSTCATCDAAFYKNKVVAVAGGGDSAMEEAGFLTRFAKKVYIVHRKNSFRASPIMAERVLKNDKIEVIWNHLIDEVAGEDNVRAIVIQEINETGGKVGSSRKLEIDGLFLAIGHVPVNGYLDGSLKLDEAGYVVPISSGSVKTNINGVFVAGELTDHVYKQAITTAADGCKAALEAQRYLESL
jgi:thioredoxin reductase (NADPH)